MGRNETKEWVERNMNQEMFSRFMAERNRGPKFLACFCPLEQAFREWLFSIAAEEMAAEINEDGDDDPRWASGGPTEGKDW